MDVRTARRLIGIGLAVVGFLTPRMGDMGRAQAGLKRSDPAQVLPLDQLTAESRESVAEVIRDNHFHRQGKADTFPCHPRLYMKLVNEPVITLALWKDLATSPARLSQVGPNRYEGTDGAGTTASWEYALRSPRLNVMLCNLEYVSPRGNAKLNGRVVMIVRSGYFRETNGSSWIQHEVEAFVKVDSRGWKAVAVTVRPLIERLLEEQVEEAGQFVSLMGRLVESYPGWAVDVANRQDGVPTASRASFVEVVNQTKKPNSQNGRPVMVDSGTTRTK